MDKNSGAFSTTLAAFIAGFLYKKKSSGYENCLTIINNRSASLKSESGEIV